MMDFMFCLLDEHVKPFAEIRGHNVHKAEPRNDFMPRHVQFDSVQKYELHLYDWQGHSGGRCQCYEYVVAYWIVYVMEQYIVWYSLIYYWKRL